MREILVRAPARRARFQQRHAKLPQPRGIGTKNLRTQIREAVKNLRAAGMGRKSMPFVSR